MFDYGISDIVIGDDNVKSKVASFGDGMTRISTVGWDGPVSGVQICRSELLNNTPFQKFKHGEDVNPNNLPDDDKIYIVFDNVKSIDVMIESLNEAKELLTPNNPT